MSATEKESQVIFGLEPAFLKQREAGLYLGHSGEWLRIKAKEHDLFKPSVGISRPGSPNKYYIEHLKIIIRHLLDPEIVTADIALKAWLKTRDRDSQSVIDSSMSGTKRKPKHEAYRH